jgi:hypothetical protein
MHSRHALVTAATVELHETTIYHHPTYRGSLPCRIATADILPSHIKRTEDSEAAFWAKWSRRWRRRFPRIQRCLGGLGRQYKRGTGQMQVRCRHAEVDSACLDISGVSRVVPWSATTWQRWEWSDTTVGGPGIPRRVYRMRACLKDFRRFWLLVAEAYSSLSGVLFKPEIQGWAVSRCRGMPQSAVWWQTS